MRLDLGLEALLASQQPSHLQLGNQGSQSPGNLSIVTEHNRLMSGNHSYISIKLFSGMKGFWVCAYCVWASRVFSSWHRYPCSGKFDIRIYPESDLCIKSDLLVAMLLTSPCIYLPFLIKPFSLLGLPQFLVDNHRWLLLVLFSIQLPAAVCSWDAVWCVHHRNHDPWRTDQMLTAGKGVVCEEDPST